jgi:hypothetical protein
VVWLLLEGDDSGANERAAVLLRRELSRLERQIQLPEQSTEGPQMRLALPLRLSFSVLRLSRKERAEQPFVRLLLHSEEELAVVRGPILLPVFGRGRLLCSLCGGQLTAEDVERTAKFLCGACSCQTKELNPGVDLLLAGAWEQLPVAPGESGTTPATPESAQPSADPEPSQETAESTAETSGERRSWLWVATLVAVGLVVGTGVWAMASRKK